MGKYIICFCVLAEKTSLFPTRIKIISVWPYIWLSDESLTWTWGDSNLKLATESFFVGRFALLKLTEKNMFTSAAVSFILRIKLKVHSRIMRDILQRNTQFKKKKSISLLHNTDKGMHKLCNVIWEYTAGLAVCSFLRTTRVNCRAQTYIAYLTVIKVH